MAADHHRQPIYESGECEIDLGRRQLRIRGAAAPLGARAFEIVEVLVRSGGALITKDDLIGSVWRGGFVPDNTLQVHISAVRRAFGPYRALLRTEAGRGYRLLGDWTARQHDGTAKPFTSNGRQISAEAPPTNLPARSVALIGRAEAVKELRDLLSAYRVVTLTGPGGIGKTVLAQEVARGVLPNFRDGSWLVDLASISTANLVPTAVSTILDLTLGGGAISAEAIARAIGERHLFLVLDNCEHVIDAAAGLAETILRLCPHATLLATSREVLRIGGECVYRVPPLDVPPLELDKHDELLGHSAVELFLMRTQAQDSSFSLDSGDLSAVAAICRHLDGIPLALEFAAARAATLGLPQVAAMLSDRFRLLTGGRRTALPRHQTLRAALDWSYELLPPGEAVVLRQLAVFAGDFSLEAAIALVGDAAVRVAEDIANLAAKSLIVAEPRDGVAHYRLLETIRLYALEKARAASEFERAARRHAEYYRALFLPAEEDSEKQTQAEWLDVYGGHLDNVRAALGWAFSTDGDPDAGVALTAAVVPLWIVLSLLDECRARVETALASLGSASADTERLRMQLSAALAWSLMYGVGRAREAGPAWATTLELAERLDDNVYRLRSLWGLCIDQFNNGEFRKALEYARRFAALVDNSSDVIDVMMGDRILATALHYLGDQKSARHHIDRALALLAPLAQQPQVVRLRFDMRVSTHYFQARILWLQGFAARALQVVEWNIEEGLAIGHALTFCSVLGQAACPITFLAGDLDAAASYGAMLLEHTERHPVRLWQLWARCFLSLVAIKRGDTVDGLANFREELERAADARFLPRFLLLLGELAACLGEAGEVGQGLATVDDALTRCKARDEGWYLPELLRIRGELLLKQGAAGPDLEGKDCFGEALQIARQQGALFWELRTALSLARLWLAEDRPEAARNALSPVYRRFTDGFSTRDLAASKALLDALPTAGGEFCPGSMGR